MTTEGIDGIITESYLSDAPPTLYRTAGDSDLHRPVSPKAQYGSAEDLGEVMNISLKDVVNTTFADQ